MGKPCDSTDTNFRARFLQQNVGWIFPNFLNPRNLRLNRGHPISHVLLPQIDPVLLYLKLIIFSFIFNL
ncbi:hypothetical protein EUGRSUZ_G01910 [Eucalyptus grandis]|uniref:Uncharacterized protein n=2 Tax=Eucalyptus grandis TaxID=71139 RepID=A0ACC3K4K1_EUCGR|nr:hypothetical protein EUGRSUZ_G01910 [Eucalyptus grandis]